MEKIKEIYSRLAKVESASFLQSRAKDDPEWELPAIVLVGYCMTKMKKQKIVLQQLHVVKFLLDFLVKADTDTWAEEGIQETTRKKLNEVKQQWKALKEEYCEQVEKIETAIPQLLDKVDQLQSKKVLLEEALQQYKDKAEAMEVVRQQQRVECTRLAGCAVEIRQRIRLCEEQIERLQTEVGHHQERCDMWMEIVTRDSDLRQLMEMMSGIRLVSASEQNLVLELLDPGTDQAVCELQPLRLTLHWTKEHKLQIQTDSTFITASDVLPAEQVVDAGMAILEMQNAYRSQARILRELQELQDKFPIDWRPKERKLMYLKGTTVCVLLVDPGYPIDGGIRLHSLQGYKGSEDIRLLKPPHRSPTLCQWLVYLSSISTI